MYNEKILGRFKNPKYAGEIEDADAVGEVGNVKCGDIMKVFIKVDNGIIKKIKFKTYGCIAAIASSDYLCELAEGKTLEEAKKITSQDVVDIMGGDVPVIKIHCSVLAQDALKKAIEEYNKK
jgi:nitrogen fixation protein NifU and related proteins